jgi:hypothetical protein
MKGVGCQFLGELVRLAAYGLCRSAMLPMARFTCGAGACARPRSIEPAIYARLRRADRRSQSLGPTKQKAPAFAEAFCLAGRGFGRLELY